MFYSFGQPVKHHTMFYKTIFYDKIAIVKRNVLLMFYSFERAFTQA